MKTCNVVSLTKVQPNEINSDNIEVDQISNAILENNQLLQYEETLDDELKNKIYDLIIKLSTDIVYIHNNIVKDITVDLLFNQSSNEFEITVNFIQSGETLDSSLFDLAIEYYNKYEEIVIESQLFSNIAIDFNTMTKNENLHIITRFSGGVKS